MEGFWNVKTYLLVVMSLVLGAVAGIAMYRFSWADSSYHEGYRKAVLGMKRQFEKVMREDTMFYSEELGVVFVSKGGDTFEVVVPGALGQERKSQ